MASPVAEDDPPFIPFTKAERIQQLNDIDKSITNLLHSAGLALKTLTASQSPSTDRREAFQNTSNEYLKTLQSVDVRLRRQIYGLEEANIIPAEILPPPRVKKDAPKQILGFQKILKPSEQQSDDQSNWERGATTIAEGGMGKLDTGWLNTRSGRVERDMEAEQWKKVRSYLEGIDGDDGGSQNGSKDEDHNMGS